VGLALFLSLFSFFLFPFSFPVRGDKEEFADPLPLRRVLLPAEKLPAELKRLREGVLMRMRRSEFEELLRQAAKAQKQKEAPRLVEARYRAALSETALVGTAQWKVLHQREGAALLRLQGDGQAFNLAVKQPRYENRDALLGEFPDPSAPGGRSLALLVDRPGEHTVLFEWSARAEVRPEGLQVDLKVPPCPAGLFEITLPADHTLSSLDGTLVSGPHAADNPGSSLWKVACGERAHLQLLIRRGGQAEPLLLARQKTLQKLSPDGLEAVVSFHVEALHQEVRELICECDPILRPIDVVAPFLEGWKVNGKEVHIRMERPLREGVIEIRCLAPLTATGVANKGMIAWTSPAVRLARAVPRGETLELWLHPELRVASWQPGDFRLTESGPVLSEKKVPMRRLLLQGGGIGQPGTGRPPRRPGASLQAGAIDLRVRQQGWWVLGADQMSLTVQLDCEVRQGLLFQLSLRLPAGWDADTVDLLPADLLRTWGVRSDKEGLSLLIDLHRPLRPSSHSTLTVRLRPVGTRPIVRRDLPFPDVVLAGVGGQREGGLAIDYDEQVHRAVVRTAAVSTEPTSAGPWGKLTPHFYYSFKGEPVTGTLHLTPRPPRFAARIRSDVFLAGGRAAVQTRLVLEGEAGMPTQVEVYTTAPIASARAGQSMEPPLPPPINGLNAQEEWHLDPSARSAGNRLRRVERLYDREATAALAALAAATPLQAALFQAARPRGSFWRLTLERPLQVRQPLTLRCTRPLAPISAADPASRRKWEIPLAVVPGASRQDGEVTLHLEETESVAVESGGLREVPAGTGAPSPGAWRSFRYSDPSAWLTLQAKTSPEVAPGPRATSEAVVTGARLTTVLTAEGELHHHFRFRLLHWSQRSVPVQMPAGARILAVGVNGHWLEQFSGESDTETIHLPVLTGPGGEDISTSFEILYATYPSTSRIFSRLDATAPVLPMTPTAFTRRWLLPPGFLPLPDTGVRRLPGSDDVGGPLLNTRRPSDLFRLGPVLHLPGRQNNPLLARQQALADAAAGLRSDQGKGPRSRRLDRLVEEVAFGDYLRISHPLMLDVAALERAGIDHATAVKLPLPASESRTMPWESLGLIAVPMRAAIVLTTRVQSEQWGSSAPDSVERAVARAVECGRDPSGRFLTALEWLRTRPADRGEPPIIRTGESLEGWTAWEPVAGASQEAHLVVVQRSTMAGLGLALAGSLALVLVALRNRAGRKRLRFLLVWLGAAGVALAWLPVALRDLAWWPLLAGLTISLPWYLSWAGSARRRAPASRSSHPTTKGPPGSTPPGGSGRGAAATGVALALVLLLLGRTPGPAQAPPEARKADTATRPEVIYLVTGTGDNEPTVLVPPGLVRRLRMMARPATVPDNGIVLVTSSCDGKLVDGAAEVEAVFGVHALGDGPATLELPLADVQLIGDVLLDGARVFPVALAEPRVGYALSVRGAGRHKVELRFRVPAPGGEEGKNTSGIRQVRFSLPRLVQSRLVFHVGPGVSHLQSLVKHGGQRVIGEAGGQRLEVDLGAAATVHLRWYEEGSPARRPIVEFREAYLWDLRPDASTLTALLRYAIRDGAVPSLFVELPPGLEVRSAQAKRPAAGGPADSIVRLADWSITGASTSRVLKLDFPGPVAGAVEVMLELVPRAPWASGGLLPIPRPHGQPASQALSYLAYRAQGLEAARTNFLRLTGIRNDEFAPFWPASSRPAPASLAYASTFRRDPGNPPELRLQLRPMPVHVEADQEITFDVGPRQVEVKARVDLQSAGNDLSLVEWHIPSDRPFVVSDVRGADVGRWYQTGSRLLVWLEKTTSSTRMELTGWLPLTLPQAKGAKTPGGPPRLDLPCFRIAQAKVRTQLILRATPGLTIAPLDKPPLRSLTREGSPSPSELRYLAPQPDYGGSFAVRPGPSPSVEVLTRAGVRDKELIFTATIDYRVKGELRSVSLRLRDWPGEVDLETPARSVARRREQHRRTSGRREWTWNLDLAGVRDHYRVVLHGRMPLEEAGDGVPMPDVIPGAPARVTLVVEPMLTTQASTGLAATPVPAGSLISTQAWKPTGEEWSLRLLPREGSPQAPVQVVLAEHRMSIPDGQRWLHEVLYWLRHEVPAELRLRWPVGVEVVSTSIDDTPMPVVQTERGQLWLPLSGPAGAHQVRIRWHQVGGREPLDRPEMRLPRLEGVEMGPVVWTVDVPAGWETADGRHGLLTGANRRATIELYRASAQLALSRELVRQPRTDEQALASAQDRFARSCWLAELALKAGADPRLRASPQGTPLKEWLTQLRGQNSELCRVYHLEEMRQEAERRLRQGDTDEATGPVHGTPMSWLVEPFGKPPQVRLMPAQTRQVRQALAFSGQWLIALLIVGVISLSSVLRTALRWLWPEMMLLLGILGWQVAGPALVVLFLLALGVAGRLLLIVRGVQTLLARAALPVASGSSLHR
jgi:hypothetical protein